MKVIKNPFSPTAQIYENVCSYLVVLNKPMRKSPTGEKAKGSLSGFILKGSFAWFILVYMEICASTYHHNLPKHVMVLVFLPSMILM